MTHSGGKPHKVGDEGQRFEISYFDPEDSKRKIFGWSDDAEAANKMADSIDFHPYWQRPKVRNRFIEACLKFYINAELSGNKPVTDFGQELFNLGKIYNENKS